MIKIVLLILGILSMIYGIFILQVGSGTIFWAIWEIIGVFFFLWALLIHTDIFVRYRSIKILFHASVVAVIIVLAILCAMILGTFYSEGEKDLDYIIVLGAQVRESGPSKVLRYRLNAAIDYLNANPETKCIVSGGKGNNEPFSEAEGMYKYLLEHGIDGERIILEDQSINTVTNIKNSKNLLDESYNSVGVVTNNFHLFRALQIAKAQGLRNVSGIAADSNILYLPNNILRECFGILKDQFIYPFLTK